MGAKNKGKKSGVPKTSISKLTNKRLNKLAKQGKLKKSVGRKKLVDLLKRRTNQQVTNIDESPEDIPIEETDYDYFSKPGRDFSFLSDMDPNKKPKTKKRKRDDDKTGNVERMYEKQLKMAPPGKNVDVKALLPFKSKEKGLIHRTMEIERNEDDDAEVEETEDAADTTTAEPLTALEQVIQDELQKKDTRNQIKYMTSNLLGNPQERVSDLKTLLSFVNDKETEQPLVIKKCAIIALTNVYKDIIPGYRIRELTDTEKQQSMKKEKKSLYSYENTLVSYYHQFLELLKFLATGKKTQGKKKEEAKKKKVPTATLR